MLYNARIVKFLFELIVIIFIFNSCIFKGDKYNYDYYLKNKLIVIYPFIQNSGDTYFTQDTNIPYNVKIKLPDFSIEMNFAYFDTASHFEMSNMWGMIPDLNIHITISLGKGSVCYENNMEAFELDSVRLWLKKVDSIKFLINSKFHIAEYMLEYYEDLYIHQKHIIVSFAKKGLCADIHLSKRYYNEGDRKYFDDIINSIEIIDNPRFKHIRD